MQHTALDILQTHPVGALLLIFVWLIAGAGIATQGNRLLQSHKTRLNTRRHVQRARLIGRWA